MNIDVKLNHLSDYIKYRIDIVCQDPKRWLLTKSNDGYCNLQHYNLPSFEYYLKNCVSDKGGNYDFTITRYKTPKQKLSPIRTANFTSIITKNQAYERWFEYSQWMGTPFNFKLINNIYEE